MRRHGRESGSVLVISLTVLVGLLAVLAVAASTQRLAVRAQIHRGDQARAEAMAEAGLQRALAALSIETLADVTTIDDDWARAGERGDVRFQVGRDSFRLEVLDAGSRVNLNTATQAQLERLPLTSEQIDSILDWREADMFARPEGAKDAYYQGLGTPYNAKLGPFDTVDELLLVRGFTPQELFEVVEGRVQTLTPIGGLGEDQPVLYELLTTLSETNVEDRLNINTISASDLQRELGVSSQQANQILAGRPYARIGDLMLRPGIGPNQQRAILERFKVDDAPVRSGLINLNTAGEAVLNTLPSFTPDMASAVVARQDAGGFATLADLLDIPGLNNPVALAEVADLVSVASETFIVRVYGESGRARHALEAVVQKVDGLPKVVSLQAVPQRDLMRLWRWSEEPTTEQVLVESR
jgi:DNA uptake protein ComE-like DNA-binding protein